MECCSPFSSPSPSSSCHQPSSGTPALSYPLLSPLSPLPFLSNFDQPKRTSTQIHPAPSLSPQRSTPLGPTSTPEISTGSLLTHSSPTLPFTNTTLHHSTATSRTPTRDKQYVSSIPKQSKKNISKNKQGPPFPLSLFIFDVINIYVLICHLGWGIPFGGARNRFQQIGQHHDVIWRRIQQNSHARRPC